MLKVNMQTPSIQRANERFHTDLGWLDSKHSFNFGEHFSPRHQRHGLLLVNNDDVVAGGAGFGTHGHRDMEIVTWVIDGRLEHRDSEGNHGVLYPGLVQRMSAGSGIRHSEMNASATEPVRFVQMWVLPDTPGVRPGYEQRDVTAALAIGGLVPVASGQGHDTAISIHQRNAVLWVGRLASGATVDVPAGRYVHVFVAVGDAALTGAHEVTMVEGDAARLADVEPTEASLVAGHAGAEVLIWVTG
jgi:hypothetical protein